MKNLADLQQRKEMLKKDISNIEDKFTFKNPKESLSTFTNGFTDPFFTDKVNAEGKHTLGIKPAQILSYFTGGTSDQFIKTSTNEKGEEKIGTKTQNLFGSVTENAIKIGIAALATNYAKKSLRHKKWNRKLIGFALIYIAPFLLKFIQEKLDEFQEKEVMENF